MRYWELITKGYNRNQLDDLTAELTECINQLDRIRSQRPADTKQFKSDCDENSTS